MHSEMSQTLLRRKELLSDRTINEINLFLDFAACTKPAVKIISGDDRLKGKAVEAFADNDSVIVEGICVNETTDIDSVLLSDYLIIISGAMRMAPLHLTSLLDKLKDMNKSAFVIIDKWDMLPRTSENIEKVKKSILREFSALNIMMSCMVYRIEDNDFSSLESCKNKILARICSTYEETHKMQINKLYAFYLDKLDTEYAEIRKNARDVQASIEIERSQLAGMRNAYKVKFANINAMFNDYSLNIFEKIKLITAEECIGDADCTEYLIVQNTAMNNYVDFVMKYFADFFKQIMESYRVKTTVFMGQLVNENKESFNRMSKQKYVSAELLACFDNKITEVISVDDIIEDVKQMVEASMHELHQKIRIITRKYFMEENFIRKIVDKLKEISQIKTDEISEEERRIKQETAIRKHVDEVIDSSNVKIFSETDQFIYSMKCTVNRRSDDIVDSYFKTLDKILIDMETDVERRYVVG